MRCYRCGGRTEERNVRFALETIKGLVLVDEVPARVCQQCGEQTFALEVIHNLELMRDDIESDRLRPRPANNVGKAVYV